MTQNIIADAQSRRDTGVSCYCAVVDLPVVSDGSDFFASDAGSDFMVVYNGLWSLFVFDDRYIMVASYLYRDRFSSCRVVSLVCLSSSRTWYDDLDRDTCLTQSFDSWSQLSFSQTNMEKDSEEVELSFLVSVYFE